MRNSLKQSKQLSDDKSQANSYCQLHENTRNKPYFQRTNNYFDTIPSRNFQSKFQKKENIPPENKIRQLASFLEQQKLNQSKSCSANRKDIQPTSKKQEEIVTRIQKLNSAAYQQLNKKEKIKDELKIQKKQQSNKLNINRTSSLPFNQLFVELKSNRINQKNNDQKPVVQCDTSQNRVLSIQERELSSSRGQMQNILFQLCNTFYHLTLQEKSKVIQNSKISTKAIKVIKQQKEIQFNSSDNILSNRSQLPSVEHQIQKNSFLDQRKLYTQQHTQPYFGHQQTIIQAHFNKNSRCASADSNLQVNTDEIDFTCKEEIAIEEQKHNDDDVSEMGDQENGQGFSNFTIQYLTIKERQYCPDPHYLRKQTSVSWEMRAILVDWMMEVCMEFHFKRETFSLSIALLDRYLTIQQVTKKIVQLVGLTCVLIAQKIEEVFPRKVEEFKKAADNGYSKDEILEMEIHIMTSLKWELNPPTLNLWLNWYMGQWDIFISDKNELLSLGKNLYFKKVSEESYQLFRKTAHLIDCAVLDIQTLQYQPRTLIASFMYLSLGFTIGIYEDEHIETLTKSSLFLFDETNMFNKYYGAFINMVFGFNLFDLLPTIQYASSFIKLQISLNTPPGVQMLANTIYESHYEEFLQFQCHSKNTLAYAKLRNRDNF